ncbi:MAG: hypothetical protein DHS20C01_35260 [marine bacterium B5-7]|nr:MAG: hypothetical protein DHS20C01_35260 [marine bacterium B5-7]
MSQENVSVVVPVFNGERTIERCIESILASVDLPGHFEVVVVDNNSRDSTPDILKGFGDRIRVFNEPIRGSSAARNTGIREAKYDQIALTDADCVVEPEWLRNLILPLADCSIGLSGGPILPLADANPVELFGESIYDHKAAISEWQPPFAITANWAMNRKLLQHVGDFDIALYHGHDVDLSWRMLKWGYCFRYVPDAIVYHHNRSTRRNLFVQGFMHGHWGVAVLKKHREFLDSYQVSRIDKGRYLQIFKDILGLISSEQRSFRFLSITFNSAKVIGRIAGAIRFRHCVL